MNTTTKILLWALTTTAMLGTGSAQAMDFIIDNFEATHSSSPQSVRVGQTAVTPPRTQIPFSEESMGISPSPTSTMVLGGMYRDLVLMDVAGQKPIDIKIKKASALVKGGKLLYSNDSSITSKLKLQWDGEDGLPGLNTHGLGGINLTQNGSLDTIAVDFLSADDTISTIIDIYDMGGKHAQAKFTFTTPIVNQTVYFALTEAAFNALDTSNKVLLTSGLSPLAAGSMNFTKVGAMELTLTSTKPGQDAQVSLPKLITVASPPNKVPEPTVSLLGLVGITVLGVAYKKLGAKRSQ